MSNDRIRAARIEGLDLFLGIDRALRAAKRSRADIHPESAQHTHSPSTQVSGRCAVTDPELPETFKRGR